MRDALLFSADEKSLAEALASPGGIDEHARAFAAWAGELGARALHGAPLAPTQVATTVRVGGGDVLTTDGPFAETKEQLAGFFLMECKDLDEELVDALAATGELEGYYLLHATRADLLRRVGRWAEAEDAYRRALELTSNAVERAFLERRLAEVRGRSS